MENVNRYAFHINVFNFLKEKKKNIAICNISILTNEQTLSSNYNKPCPLFVFIFFLNAATRMADFSFSGFSKIRNK